MTRPSKNTDIKLLQAGKELIPLTGFSGLSVRDVARRAGVNLGMFNYHFGTKEKYIEVLIKEVYNQFFVNFKLESETGDNSYERLRNALINAAFFIRDNRMLVITFVQEIMSGNKKMLKFARKNLTGHIYVAIDLLKRCQKDGYIVKAPILTIAPIIIGSIALPNLAMRVLEKNYKNTFFGAVLPIFKKNVLSDKVIINRIDLILKGLSTGR